MFLEVERFKELEEVIEDTYEIEQVDSFDTEYEKDIPVFAISTNELKLTFWNSSNKEDIRWGGLKSSMISKFSDEALDEVELSGELSDGWNTIMYEIDEI